MTENNKFYWVENAKGGYSEKFTFEEACQIAETDSIEDGTPMFVIHETGYVPTRIYYYGHVYEQVNKGDDES